MTHHIRQYHLHLDLNGTEAEGLALQSQLTTLCYDRLLPALERVLDDCVPPDVHLSLDRLVIEAGTLALDRLEYDGPTAVAQAVEKVLREQMERLNATPPQSSEQGQLKSNSRTVDEAFFYFLSTGRLPWAFRLPEGRSLEQVVRRAWAEAAGPAAIPSRVGEPLRRALASAAVRQRLVWQFSAALRESLLAAFWPETERLLATITATLRGPGHAAAAPVPETALAGFERQLWENVLAAVASAGASTAAALIGETWRRLPASARQQTALANLLERHWPGSTRAPASAKPAAKAPDAAPGTRRAAPPEEGAPRPLATAAENSAEAREGYYLDNAGLVLLHPFLPRFFEGLGLAAHDQLLQPERALSLLHFLATSQLIAPEHALTLPKLLCAVPLAQPVAAEVALTTAETDEAEALLRAVVQHWTALRSTSPDALRGTFLARSGKLSLRPDGDWLLQVELMSYDILLDQLPWGISMIQLPWMAQLLRVEWG
jgi:hypothetical protein